MSVAKIYLTLHKYILSWNFNIYFSVLQIFREMKNLSSWFFFWILHTQIYIYIYIYIDMAMKLKTMGMCVAYSFSAFEYSRLLQIIDGIFSFVSSSLLRFIFLISNMLRCFKEL